MGRKKRDPNLRKNEFISVATDLFLLNGYENTSLQDILTALGGMSPSVFYYYFKSKDALLDACLDSYVNQYANDMIQLLSEETTDYAEKMQKIMLRIQKALHDVHFLIQNGTQSSTFHNLIADRYFNMIMPEITKLINDGLKSGAFPMTDLARAADPQMIARLICNGIATLFHEGVLVMPTSPHNFDNVKFVPVYVAQILGVPVSMFERS